jgi:hypothetical protein
MRTITWLDLSGTGITDEGLQYLASSPYLGKFRYLRIDEAGLSEGGKQLLAERFRK